MTTTSSPIKGNPSLSSPTSITGTTSPLGVFDDPKYAKLALDNAEKYRTADPYPHIIFDDFLPDPIARSIHETFPKPDDASVEWIIRDNQHNLKRYQHDETKLPRTTREILRELNSRQFILFLETLTGIENLIPDPYYIGGGAHLGSRGDFLKIHADFNWHHKLLAHRRVNVLYYPNLGWQEEWGGALELWNKEMTERKAHYFPMFNRLLVFNVEEHSNHGHPHPLACPPNEHRKTLNLYYYTTKTDQEVREPHFTVYRTEASSFASELGANYRRTGGQQ